MIVFDLCPEGQALSLNEHVPVEARAGPMQYV